MQFGSKGRVVSVISLSLLCCGLLFEVDLYEVHSSHLSIIYVRYCEVGWGFFSTKAY